MKDLLIKIILTLSLALVAWAQPTDAPTPKERGNPMAKYDSNGDQQLSPEEFARSPKLQALSADKVTRLFTFLDKDSSGFLTSQELPHRKGGEGGGRPHMRLKIREMDTNQDQQVSQAEFIAARSAQPYYDADRAASIFSHLDKDADGFLTKADHPKRPEHHPHRPKGGEKGERKGERKGEHPPRNEDGAPRPHRDSLLKMLQRLDTDQNGEVSPAEFLAGPKAQRDGAEQAQKHFDRLDRNGDGILTPADKRP